RAESRYGLFSSGAIHRGAERGRSRGSFKLSNMRQRGFCGGIVLSRGGGTVGGGGSRAAYPPLCRKDDRAGERGAHRTEARFRAREFVSWDADAAGEAGKERNEDSDGKGELIGIRGDEMKGEYLWDGSGEREPELQKLERALGQFRASAEAPPFA